MSVFIEVDHLTHTYNMPGGESHTALKDLSLSIHEGELVAIVGANGSGKTTLARHFNALYVPTQGSVIVGGMDTRVQSLHAQVRALVGMVFQNPEDALVASVVEEDAAFGLENMGLPPAEIRKRVADILYTYDLYEVRQRPPHMLSTGQIQRLALAGVLVMQPRCIVFDETTAMLDPMGRSLVMKNIQDLHKQGMTIIYITHDMEEASLAERVIVLDHGQVALDGCPKEIFVEREVLHKHGLDLPPVAALAMDLRDIFPVLSSLPLTYEEFLSLMPPYAGGAERKICQAHPAEILQGIGEGWISVDGLGHVYMKGTPLEHRGLAGASMQAGRKETHALLGATGSGKSTLLQHLNGLYIPQEGIVKVGPFSMGGGEDVDMYALRRFAGLAFQNPDTQLFEQYVGDEIAYGPRQMGLEREVVRENVRQAMMMVGLDYDLYKDRFTFGLSGGERKKVVLASTLALKPQILILDEPFAGLDPLSRRDLLTMLTCWTAEGMTLVVSSHQIEEIAPWVSGVTVLKSGKTVISGMARQVFGDPNHLNAAGLGVPLFTRIATGLRERGWPIPGDLLSNNELVVSIRNCVRGE